MCVHCVCVRACARSVFGVLSRMQAPKRQRSCFFTTVSPGWAARVCACGVRLRVLGGGGGRDRGRETQAGEGQHSVCTDEASLTCLVLISCSLVRFLTGRWFQSMTLGSGDPCSKSVILFLGRKLEICWGSLRS